MKIGLYFGTFNPIHIGHMAIANYLVEFTDIQQLWFVISPQNPFKKGDNLLKDYHRLEMVYRVIEGDKRFRVSDIEFRLPKPSFTIDTLTYLKEKHPAHEYSLVMGADNLKSIRKWKNAALILRDYRLLVYPRPGYPVDEQDLDMNIQLVEAPLMEVSASFIRQSIAAGKNVRWYVPEKAWQYLSEMNFYK